MVFVTMCSHCIQWAQWPDGCTTYIHSSFNHDNHTWSQHSCTLPVKAFIACSPLSWPAAAHSAHSSSAIVVIRGMYCSLVFGLNADRNILRMLRCCCPLTMASVFWPKMVPMVKGQSSAYAINRNRWNACFVWILLFYSVKQQTTNKVRVKS